MAKMKIAERDRPRVKLTPKVNPARTRLIEYFVDSYVRLNLEETKRFERDRMYRNGARAEGADHGNGDQWRKVLISVPESAVRRLDELSSDDELEALPIRILTVSSLEELGLARR